MNSFKYLLVIAAVGLWAQASYAGIAVVGALNMSNPTMDPMVRGTQPIAIRAQELGSASVHF